MNTKIEITEAQIKGDWLNAKTAKNGEVSINLKSCPNLSKSLNEGTIYPIEIEVNLVEKNGKQYAWDVSEEKKGGGGMFPKLTPEQLAQKKADSDHTQRMIVAQSSLSAAVQFYQGRSTGDSKSVKDMATEYYNWVMQISEK